jgi:hypothetical protein
MAMASSGSARKRRRAVAVGELATGILSPLIARRAGMTAQLLAGWRDVIGAEHGPHTRPERIVWPRRTGVEDNFSPGMLVIACEASHALWVQHETGQVIANVNRFLGFSAIDRIRIVQKPVSGGASQKPPKPQLDTAENKRLRAVLDRIEEPGLRERLRKLGEGVISRRRDERKNG